MKLKELKIDYINSECRYILESFKKEFELLREECDRTGDHAGFFQAGKHVEVISDTLNIIDGIKL